VAKKVRKKLEEEEASAFEFPVFDEVAFTTKEFELTWGLTLAALISVLLGVVAWALSVAGLFWYEVFPLGLVILGISPKVIGRLREKSTLYTRGDWTGLIALEFFTWLALWFVLLNLSPAHG
jgi:hypothetical protein